MKKIQVLVCDDSALMRRSIKNILESDPKIKVMATARDGEDAVAKARELIPDVITMDINMPGIDGITALQIIMNEKIAPVLMVSSLTQEGAVTTLEAMALGAFDYVAKPGGTVSIRMEPVARELVAKVKAAARPGTLTRLFRVTDRPEVLRAPRQPVRPVRAKTTGIGFKAVALGVSTGGPKSLFDVLPFLPEDLNAAVFIVQHMPGKFTRSFAERIDHNSPMRCIEASGGLVVEPGTIYLGHGGYHLTLFKRLGKKIYIRTPTRPAHRFIPSVDVMMESVLDVFGADTIGVLMTGMGDDGARAMVKIREAGGKTIAESEESAIVFGMPREAIEMGGAEKVVPSWSLADEIIRAVGNG